MIDPIESLRYVKCRTDEWFNHLSGWCNHSLGIILVKPKLSVPCCLKGNKAGWYVIDTHTVVLPLPWAMEAETAYDEIIAHEMCHAVQQQVYCGSAWHGEMFYFLLNTVCGKEPTKYHTLHIDGAKSMHKILHKAYKGIDLANLI